MTISPDKSERLQAFFDLLSTSGRQNLVMTIKAAIADGDGQLPCSDLLSLLGDEGMRDERWQALFSVAQPLIAEPVQGCDQISSDLGHDVWDYFLRELNPAMASALLADKENIATVRRAIVADMDKLRQSDKGANGLKVRLGTDSLLQLDILLSLLRHCDELEDFFSGWPETIKNLNEAHLGPLREFNDHLMMSSPEITPYLLFLVKTRLKHPYQIFRAVEKITGHTNDRVMVKTELKMVGDALLDKNDVWLETFRWDKGQTCNPEELVSALQRFTELTHGWLSEFDIDPAGPWGKRLLAQRGRCGKQWDSFMNRIYKSIDQIMPRKRGTVTGRQTMPDLNREIDKRTVALGENAVALLRTARPFATQGGFHSSKDKAVQFLESRLGEQSDDLLALFSRADAADYKKLSAHFAILVRITKVFVSEEDGNILARRGAAAMAA